MEECERNQEDGASTSQEVHATVVTAAEAAAAAASALQSLEGKIRSGCSGGFASAFLWGRFGAAASQCPKSHKPCGFHKDPE